MSAACQQIVMSPRGSIGDCAPIAVASGGIVTLGAAEREKAESPIVQEFNDSAQVNGLNPIILRAMVVGPVEVHELHNTRTNETVFVDTPGKSKLLAEELDVPGGGKEHPWQFVRTVDDDKSLLTVGATDALAMKLSKATIDNQEQLKAAMNIRGELMVLDFDWAERATVFLTQTWIRLILFVAMLVFGVDRDIASGHIGFGGGGSALFDSIGGGAVFDGAGAGMGDCVDCVGIGHCIARFLCIRRDWDAGDSGVHFDGGGVGGEFCAGGTGRGVAADDEQHLDRP